MRVVELLVKRRRGAPMTEVAALEGVAGVGLVGDCHAQVASPRHVLVCSKVVLDECGLPAAAVRANVVVDGLVDGFPSGTILRLGTLSLRLMMSCESCRKLETFRPGLARGLEGRRGMLARVVGSGTTKVGDDIQVVSTRHRPLAANWQERVADIVEHVPEGMLLTYPKLAELAGVQSTYCRAFPRVIARLGATDRVVPSSIAKLHDRREWDGAGYY